MKTLLAIMLLTARIAVAQNPTSTQLISQFGGSHNSYSAVSSGGANKMTCCRYPALFSVSSVTHLTGNILGSGVSGTLGLAIYDDTDDTSSSHVECSVHAPWVVNGAAIGGTCSAFSLQAGTLYRWCGCFTATNPTLMDTFDTSTAAQDYVNILNTVSPHCGTAANSCSAGTPPANTGAITGDQHGMYIFSID